MDARKRDAKVEIDVNGGGEKIEGVDARRVCLVSKGVKCVSAAKYDAREELWVSRGVVDVH